jgi:hypothetical protein
MLRLRSHTLKQIQKRRDHIRYMLDLDSTSFIRLFSQELETVTSSYESREMIRAMIMLMAEYNRCDPSPIQRAPAPAPMVEHARCDPSPIQRAPMVEHARCLNYHLHTLFSRSEQISCIAIDLSWHMDDVDYIEYYKRIPFRNNRARQKYVDKFTHE